MNVAESQSIWCLVCKCYVLSNMIVDVAISRRSFVFGQSRAKVSAGFTNISGLAAAAFDLLFCSLSVLWRTRQTGKLTGQVNNQQLTTTHCDSKDDYRTGCPNVSHCQQQPSYSGLRSPWRSYSSYLLIVSITKCYNVNNSLWKNPFFRQLCPIWPVQLEVF